MKAPDAERAYLAGKLKAARHDLGYSARTFGPALDPLRPPNPRTVRRWESGANRVPGWVWVRVNEMLHDAGLDSIGTGQ